MPHRMRVDQASAEGLADRESDPVYHCSERVATSPPAGFGEGDGGRSTGPRRKEGGLQIRRYQVAEALLAIAASAFIVLAYFGYWIAWCAVWSAVWATGPEWFVRPSVESFLLVCFTAVIITIAIFRLNR